jgi:hypothetical protein
VCINCDRDFDTYRAAHSPFCSQPTNDCRDVNGFDDPNINPGMNESGFCQDGKDNNCNSEADYDGFTSGTINPAVHGDSACPVSIVGMSAPATVNTAAACSGGATVAVTCTTNVGNIRSVLATLGSSGCAFTGWSGTTASFTCARPATDGAYTARCTVNGAQSYQFGADQTRQVVVDCARNVSGKVTDASSGNGIASATVRVTDTAQQATSQSDGSYKIVDVPVGTHNLTATASSGFYMGKVFGRLVSAEPTVVNFPLDPWQCTSNCTFGEQDFCDYRCMQAGTECTFTGVAAQDKQRFIDTCREAPKGSLREFNASHVANCCLGPIAPKENYKTPLTIQSCARELIPHTTLVNYNGRIHRLTVLSYRECEE